MPIEGPSYVMVAPKVTHSAQWCIECGAEEEGEGHAHMHSVRFGDNRRRLAAT